MRSATTSVKLPEPLKQVAKKRAGELGYRSLNAYLAGLLRYDLTIQKPHPLTVPISTIPLKHQDKIDADLLALTEKGEGIKGVWFERTIERILEKHGLLSEEMKETIKKELPEELV